MSTASQHRDTQCHLRRWPALVLLMAIIAVFVLLGFRCVQLQVYRYQYFHDTGIEQQQSRHFQTGARGVILDSRGRVLAASNRMRTVFAEPRILADPKETATLLSSAIDMPAHEICKLIMESRNPGFAPIQSGLELTQARQADGIRGIGIQYDWIRYYPLGPIAAHVVGFISQDGKGLGGMEFQYDNYLSGKSQEELLLADVRRRPIRWLHPDTAVLSRDTMGRGIILTIDSTVQEFVREELFNQWQAYEAESAIAIVADPWTGAIRAMVSLPDFEPTEARNTDPRLFTNHVLVDQFEPGSVMKPFVAAIALDTGVVNKQEKIFCEEGHYSGKGFGRIGEYGEHAFGDLTVREIIVESSNIGMAKIGQRLGAQRLYPALLRFGFGQKTGIHLPGEAEGLVRPLEQWDGYSVTRIPFGHEISVTSLQLLKSLCILVNQGRLIRPHVITAFVDSNGVPQIRDTSFGVAGDVGYIIDPDIARWMVQDAMVGVVNEGTGRRAKLKQWQAFGKTGTAQIPLKEGRGYEDGAYIASFMGGAPADDPAIVVLVSIYKPNRKLGKGYTGGMVAAPVAGRIMERTLEYFSSCGLLKPSQKPRSDPAEGLL